MRLSLDPHAIHQRLVALGEEWAEANAAAALLEEAKRTVEAKLTNDALGRERVSKAASEVEALAHPDYRAHIEAMVEARKRANICKVRYDAARVWADLAHSANANRRAELQNLRHAT